MKQPGIVGSLEWISTQGAQRAPRHDRHLDDELGIVEPGMFIPVLEHYNLVHNY